MLPDHAADPATRDLLAFIEAAPTPYHAVSEVKDRLARAGFRQLSERETWALGPGERGFVVRGGGSIAAFRLGNQSPAQAGFAVVGAHTDSPNLRLKPQPEYASEGYALWSKVQSEASRRRRMHTPTPISGAIMEAIRKEG